MAEGLYIHIPFCVKKCKYCDFISFEDGDKEGYIQALLNELELYRGAKIDSVFIGGGTPSVLDTAQIERIFAKINAVFNLSADTEWSVEVNPSTFDREKLALMRDMGANRLSIGVQSFDDDELGSLGRIHSSKKAVEAICLAKEYFSNINIDLISAVPNQTLESFTKTLQKAISLAPQHISCYSLILEEGTPLFDEYEAGKLVLPSEDCERDIYDMACCMLEACGYTQYEISNFAQKGFECRHNKKYWKLQNYIGAGLAAHSLRDGLRRENTTDLKSYVEGRYLLEEEHVTEADLRFEFIIMTLRLIEGIDESEYSARFGSSFYGDYKKQLDKFIKLGLMQRTEVGFALTKRGISLSNSVLCEFAE